MIIWEQHVAYIDHSQVYHMYGQEVGEVVFCARISRENFARWRFMCEIPASWYKLDPRTRSLTRLHDENIMSKLLTYLPVYGYK